MRPILFQAGPVTIWSHSVFVVSGMVTALIVVWQMAKRTGRANQELIWIIAGGLVGAAILAKFGLVLRYVHDATEPTLAGFLRYGGRTLLGGLGGAYAGVVLTKRMIGYRRHTGDLMIPGVALGIAIGRIGCFLAERPGQPTTLPWGVSVPPDAAERLGACDACRLGLAMHPSFLYESAFLLLAAIVLFALAIRPKLPATWLTEGDLFKLFLLTYAIFRFLVEFVRGNPVMAFGLSGSQLLALPSAIILTLYFLNRWRARDINRLSPVPA